MVIYGNRTVRIKKYKDHGIKCENCNGYEHEFSIYQNYFHLFFIPTVPWGIKQVTAVCPKCKGAYSNVQERGNHYIAVTRSPIYMYMGAILLAGLFGYLMFSIALEKKQMAQYVANPMVGDVYLMNTKEKQTSTYYFLKVRDIKADTLELLYSAYQYSGTVSEMDKEDYFVADDAFMVLKSSLKTFLDDKSLSSVKRGYPNSSRFMIEKDSEEPGLSGM